MVTLRNVLLQPALPGGAAGFHTLPGAAPPSLSQKQWVHPYEEVSRPLIYINPTQDMIDAAFGAEDDLDRHLLDMDVNPLNGTAEYFQTEGDTVRTFYTHVSHPIQLAFQTNHGSFIVQRSESGPLGPTQVSQTIDFTWGCGDHCLMIGELKRHGIIDRNRWTGERPPDGNRIRLGKELRAYCHKYKCFAASVFDGQHLLILVFHAQTVQQIREQDCEVTGLLFSTDWPTLRYGLFRAVTYQIRRMQAATAPAVTLDGYVRRYRWRSWAPYWVDGNNEHEVHPNGYKRLFLMGAWYWADAQGNPILYQDGQWVWDTVGLGW